MQRRSPPDFTEPTLMSSNHNYESSRPLPVTITRHHHHHHHRKSEIAWGIQLIRKLASCLNIQLTQQRRNLCYQVSILVITYLSYCAYHLSRKPISIVKNVLNQNCSNSGVTPSPGTNTSNPNYCDWAPFDGKDAEILLGTLDSSFLFAYAAGMFVSGIVAERINLRYFLSLGMLLSGFFTYLFGLAYTRNVHNIYYFIIVQFMAGIFQTSGWPGVVTVVGNWFGKGKRGLIFGLWNSHTSLGNILGSLIAGEYVEKDWGLSFIVPAAIIGFMGFIVFLFLVPKPQHVECTPPDHHGIEPISSSSSYSTSSSDSSTSIRKPAKRTYYEKEDERSALLNNGDSGSESETIDIIDPTESTPIISNYAPEIKIKAIGFTDALKIPGVIEFSLCLFFAKLVSYTFLYWLPRYINNSTTFSPTESANLSTLFDVGGILGGIIAGVISDYSGMSATTCAFMLSGAIPTLLVYQTYGADSLWTNIILLIIVGLLVNGPYALITTAVSTELGTHPCLLGNARALATVTAIIDGTGSIGAAVGPLLAGPISDVGWNYVFYLLMIADAIALLLLSRLVLHEVRKYFERRRLTVVI